MSIVVRSKRAWVISWRSSSEGEGDVVSILSWRYSGRYIRKIVEQLYADQTYTWEDRVRFTQGKRDGLECAKFIAFEPRPAGPGGWYEGMIECGHNPHLYARVVTNVSVSSLPDGTENISWKEPKLVEIAAEIMNREAVP